jgi:uncharacterized protein YegL
MATAIPDVSLIDNSDERLPIVLVLDCSGSMDGEPIGELNQGLKDFEAALSDDPAVATRGRILTVTFGGDDDIAVSQWQDAMDWKAPALEANGRTPTGAAVRTALEAIEAQKAELRNAGVSYKRPLLILMSDGAPTDDWESVADSCKAAENSKKVSVYPIAIGSGLANDEEQREAQVTLTRFSNKAALRLKGMKYKELFVWLSQSVRAASKSATGEAVQLSSPAGWAVMETS